MLKENYIDDNPVSDVARLKEQRKINDYEIKQMLVMAKKHPYKHIAQRNTVLLMLMIEYGVRISEICQIVDEDIMSNQITIKNTKNNKDRAVAVSLILKKEIKKYQRLKKRKYGVIIGNPFIISNLGKKLNEKSIWQIMQGIKRKICLRECIRFSRHTLRHTYASMQLRNGFRYLYVKFKYGA